MTSYDFKWLCIVICTFVSSISGCTAYVNREYHAPTPPFVFSCKDHGGLKQTLGPIPREKGGDYLFLVQICNDGAANWNNDGL
jgi:hypothetical protein